MAAPKMLSSFAWQNLTHKIRTEADFMRGFAQVFLLAAKFCTKCSYDSL
jgi:hypothetical protein